jgi:hypothetical protein
MGIDETAVVDVVVMRELVQPHGRMRGHTIIADDLTEPAGLLPAFAVPCGSLWM